MFFGLDFGSTLINSGAGIEGELESTYYIALRLYVLICSLVLKSAGFSGYVLNFPKIHEKTTGVILEGESFYREIQSSENKDSNIIIN